MSEIENGSQVSSRLRPRRSSGALSDISNTFFQQINHILPKKGAKKRKYTEEQEASTATSSAIAPTINETKTFPANPSIDTSDISVTTIPLPNNTKESTVVPVPELLSETSTNKIVSVGSDRVEPSTISVCSSTSTSKIEERMQFERDGFIQPPKIHRRVPLQSKGADPLFCLEHLDDMYAFYKEDELKYSPKNYFVRQTEVTPRMRTILIDWLLEVHYKYKLQTSTLWLCINLLDRYLEVVDVPRTRLQLVGITSLLIACKFEEIHSPEVKDCVYLTDSAYNRRDILQMEMEILNKLDFQLHVPTGFHFLSRFLSCIKASERIRLIAFFTAERSMQEPDMLDYSPRVYAAASVYVALRTIAEEVSTVNLDKVWPISLQEESSLQVSDFIVCARALANHNGEIPQSSSRRKIESARKKYNTQTNQEVSLLTFPTL